MSQRVKEQVRLSTPSYLSGGRIFTFPYSVTSTVGRKESIEWVGDIEIAAAVFHIHTPCNVLQNRGELKSVTDLCSCVHDHWDCCIFHTLFYSPHHSSECWKEDEVTFITTNLEIRQHGAHLCQRRTAKNRLI